MSLEINSSTPLIVPPSPAGSQQASAADLRPVHKHEETHHSKDMRESRAPDFDKVFDKMFAGAKHESKHFEKAFNHLAHSLEKVFAKAPKVDRQTGEEEMRHGGLRRVGNDLTRLFKGLGIPKELARQFSRDITGTIKSGDVEQVDFSLGVTKAFNLEVQQLQQGYQVDGDGSMMTTSMSNSFQLSAVQVRSLDISINMRTGELSMTRSRFDSFSMSSASTVGMASSEAEPATAEIPAEANAAATETQSSDPKLAATTQPVESAATEVTPATEADELKETPPEPTNDFNALVQTNSQLLQISRMVQQSAVMRLQPHTGVDKIDMEDDTQAPGGLNVLHDVFSRLEEMTSTANSLFESLVQVNNLRLEKEDDDDHLRFNVEALSPIGLSVTNEDGRASTVYPRPDGSLAKVVEEPITVSA